MINHIKGKKNNLGWILKSSCLTSFNPEVDMRSNWKNKLDSNETNWNEQINLGYCHGS